MRLNLEIIYIALAIGLNYPMAGAFAAGTPSLNERVVAYCEENLNKQVGNGECAELAGHALKAAGAKLRAGPDAPRERDYVWGKRVYMIESTSDGPKEIGKLSDVRPGDIIQFRDVKFGEKGGFGHHTAVVFSVVDETAGKIEVYQQNAGGNRFVFKTTIHKFQALKEGYIIIYRPVRER